MSTYPKAFAYHLTRLSNFNRQKLRLQTLANTTFNPNDQIVIELPTALLDMTTFTVQGFVNTNNGAGHGIYLPFAEGLIDSVSVECGGVSIQNPFNNYGDLFNIYRQYQMEDKKRFRRILQLEDQQTGAHGANGNAAMAFNGVTGNTPFAIYNWLGFLNSVKVLDTTLLPPVKLYIRLAPTAVLTRSITGGANVNVPTYQITDFRATCDILSIDDGVYYNMVNSRLQSSPLEIPFENYTTVAGGLGAPTQSLRWSTSADCVEAVIGTFKLANPGSFVADTDTGLSEYFTRTGQDVRDSVYRVNGVPYPTIACESAIGDIFVDTAHTLGASQDVLGQTDPLMRTLALWRDNFFVHAHSFTYPDAEDAHRLCGLSGRGNQLIGSWDTNANSGGPFNQVQPILWLKHKSVMRVGSNKMVEVIL